MTYTYEYPRPALTVDVILLVKEQADVFVLLIQRGNPPYEGMWALPGGFVDMDETLEQAALRELHEETGIEGVIIKQFYTFDAIDRDPRHRTISVVYYGNVSSRSIFMNAADDACNVGWFSLNGLPDLAFDHNVILEKAKQELLFDIV